VSNDSRGFRHKFQREHDPAELALFREYRGRRALARPAQCKGAGFGPCWVEDGPPAFCVNKSGRCIGCGGVPLARERK
jgi:hypothetical protein